MVKNVLFFAAIAGFLFISKTDVYSGSIDNTSLSGEQNIRSIVEDILLEREQEEELAAAFSEGGLENMLFHGYVDLEWKSVEFDRAQGGSRGHNFFDNHHFNLWFGYNLADNLVAI